MPHKQQHKGNTARAHRFVKPVFCALDAAGRGRLIVFVASGFMAVAVGNFHAHCRCVFKPEGEAQRAFVFVMREVENHQVMAA